jgi:hypothetical protein
MDPTEIFPWLVGAGTLVTILFVIVSIICSLVPVVAIVGGVFWFIRRRSKQASQMNQAAQNWPSTHGTVLKSRTQVSGGEYTTVSAYVEYQYEINGTLYASTRIRAGDAIMTKNTTQEVYDTVDRYPVGAEVVVYYNPANPAESALER